MASILLITRDAPKIRAWSGPAEFGNGPFQGYPSYGPLDRPLRPVDGRWLSESINDGVALLEKNRSASDRIAAFDLQNPFSFALKAPSNPGGAIWLTYNNNFSRSIFADPSRLFGSADILMVPKWPDMTPEELAGLRLVYGPYVAEHFKPVAESALWTLMRKK